MMEHERAMPTAPEWATKEIDRLRAELAAKDARVAELEAGSPQAAAKIIADLIEHHNAKVLDMETLAKRAEERATSALRDVNARAEQTEAQLAAKMTALVDMENAYVQMRHGNVQLRDDLKRAEAERGAMRELLRRARLNVKTGSQLDADISAALAPPPA